MNDKFWVKVQIVKNRDEVAETERFMYDGELFGTASLIHNVITKIKQVANLRWVK